MRTRQRLRGFGVLVGVAVAGCSGAPEPRQASPASNASAVTAAAPQRASASNQADADRALAEQVTQFLDAWIVKHNPRAAVAGRVSSSFGDERFVPAGAFDPQEYSRRFPESTAFAPASRTVTAQEFQDGVERDLAAKIEPDAARVAPAPVDLGSALAPYTLAIAQETSPQLWRIISPKEPRTIAVAGVPSLAYRVRDWSDISWTASPTIGYRFALADVIAKQNINLQAVVTRLKSAESETTVMTVVTLWSDEGTGGSVWRLLGAEIPPQH